jgi:VWFA-related protein
LVIDDATLPSDPAMVRTAKTAARVFVERLGPTDRTAIVFTRDNRAAQDFTYDKARLLAAVERISAGNLGAGLMPVPGMKPIAGPTGKASDLSYYLSSVNTLARLSDYLSTVPLRKKAIAWLSIGVPLETDALSEVTLIDGQTGMSGVEAERSIMIAMRRAIDRAQRGNVAIFGISPAGLNGISNYNRSRRNFNFPLPDERQFNEFLQAMAENTGGRAFINTNDVVPGIEQVFRETSSYYLLGYSPSPRGADGAYRRLEVKVTRPGLEVRARKGYFVTSPEAAPIESVSLGLSAIKGVLPDTGIPLRGIGSAFSQSDGTLAAVVTIGLDTGALPAPSTGDIAISTSVFDPEGRPRGSFTQQARLCAQPGWCEVSVVLPVRAGRHAFRVGIEHKASGRSGSVYLDVVAPDLTKRGIWLTGLAVEVSPAGPRATDAAVRTLLPIVPTARREVTLGDRASAFFRIYQGGTRALTDVSRTIQITDENGAQVLDRTEVLPASSFGAQRGIDQRLELPVDGLAPGRYLLTVSTRTVGAVGSPNDERRELVFVVK